MGVCRERRLDNCIALVQGAVPAFYSAREKGEFGGNKFNKLVHLVISGETEGYWNERSIATLAPLVWLYHQQYFFWNERSIATLAPLVWLYHKQYFL